MSDRFPVCSANDVVRVLRQHGFALLSQRVVTKSGAMPTAGKVIVAMHGSKPMPIGTLKSIIEGSGLSVESFRR